MAFADVRDEGGRPAFWDRQNASWVRRSRPGASNGRGDAGGNLAWLPRMLGWFSLGLAQLTAPQRLAELAGLERDDRTTSVMRALGVREIANGVGLLTRADPTPWQWARVGGDVMDLALLATAMNSPRANPQRVAATTAVVVGVTALDALCSTRAGQEPPGPREREHPAQTGAVPVATAITINAPISRVYQAAAGFRSFPRFMHSFASVEVEDDRHSRWTANLPAGLTLAWNVEITETRPDELIAWRTVDGSGLTAYGQLAFRPAPGNRGTEMHFVAEMTPPGGELGQKIAGLFSDPLGVKIQNDLRRFKQLIEIGSIVHSDDSIKPGPNPAQPLPPGDVQPIGSVA